MDDGPFDRRLRRVRRDRAARAQGGADYLRRLVADELIERIGLVTRPLSEALDLSCADGRIAKALAARGMAVTSADPGFAFARRNAGAQCDEDRLPFGDARFDLIVSAGALDTVNDLPGALVLIRRALRPDGLFLAAFAGAGSLPRLKGAMMAGDLAAGGGAAARVHPQIDVRAAGDLLLRAGFRMPVADCHALDIRFSRLADLVGDLRALGATNVLAGRAPPLTRLAAAAAAAEFAAYRDADGKTTERLEIIHLTAWSPPEA
ncbi:MAG TPA: methyltransferase domain-containing protein [Allosphingosinicella sp.]|nr:methyltransferase domain-containing protein [Allosphingosinicella sp.]